MSAPASKLSREVFKKMIAGSKHYVPMAVSRELKAANMGKLLHGSRVNKEQAIKAIRHLQDKGLLSRLKAPSVVYRQAGIKQVELDELARTPEQQKHIRANIKIDVGEELTAEDRGEFNTRYDPRSTLGKKSTDGDNDRSTTNAAATNVGNNKSKIPSKNSPAKPPSLDLASPTNLPDIDIG